VLSGDALDGVGEIFRRLGAGDDEAAAEDEARHAVDAGFLGAVRFILDAIHVGVASKEPAHQVAVQWMADVRYGVVSRSAIDLPKSRSCSINSRPMRLSWLRALPSARIVCTENRKVYERGLRRGDSVKARLARKDCGGNERK
jgi:hypothetical protein